MDDDITFEKSPEELLENSFEITMHGFRNDVKLDFETYQENGTLALQLLCRPDGEEMPGGLDEGPGNPFCVPYAVATVNLPESSMLPEDEQFVNENCQEGMGAWLQRSGIAKPSGMIAFSGYCAYQSYRFNITDEVRKKIVDCRCAANERKREELFRREHPNVHIEIETRHGHKR